MKMTTKNITLKIGQYFTYPGDWVSPAGEYKVVKPAVNVETGEQFGWFAIHETHDTPGGTKEEYIFAGEKLTKITTKL
jgi:hypothetical protein